MRIITMFLEYDLMIQIICIMFLILLVANIAILLIHLLEPCRLRYNSWKRELTKVECIISQKKLQLSMIKHMNRTYNKKNLV